jgi:hypothetical protein
MWRHKRALPPYRCFGGNRNTMDEERSLIPLLLLAPKVLSKMKSTPHQFNPCPNCSYKDGENSLSIISS